MKKICFMLSMLFVLMLLFCFASCKHEHYWDYSTLIASKNPTCTEEGWNDYPCADCDESYRITISKIPCDYVFASTTATCISPGVDTFRCSMCHKTKTESSPALGHSYSYYGHCKVCEKFKYNLIYKNSYGNEIVFPINLSYINDYTSHVYSRCVITEVYPEIQDNKLILFFSGSKTYDETNAYGDQSISFVVVIKNKDGAILFSDTVRIYGLIENQKFGENGYYGVKTIAVSKLNETDEYIIELVNHVI